MYGIRIIYIFLVTFYVKAGSGAGSGDCSGNLGIFDVGPVSNTMDLHIVIGSYGSAHTDLSDFGGSPKNVTC